ncbi:RluA family pseudouridine synthase [Caenimonas koreensis]|uniref:RluA family pseudouridine synthase n=1 Tax=Caenimonas koreensis TaxID=367474 RepID=UPI0037845034
MPGLSGLVVFCDAHLLVLDKPAGLLCVPGRGEDKQDCLASRAQAEFADALVVHRLDMATSGLCLMARGPQAQKQLSAAFERREVTKHYMAVVAGCLEPEHDNNWHTIDLPLAADWPNRPLQIVDAVAGKPSQTKWRALSHDRASNTTRVALEPLTGRTHQLRVHLKSLGHPILGDALYAPPHVQALSPRLLLHAVQLELTHPATSQRVTFSSPPPF